MCCAADLSETVFTCSPVPGAKGRERRFGVERPRSRRATAPLQAALLSQRSASAPAWSPECKCSRQRAASGLAALQLALTARLPAASAPVMGFQPTLPSNLGTCEPSPTGICAEEDTGIHSGHCFSDWLLALVSGGRGGACVAYIGALSAFEGCASVFDWLSLSAGSNLGCVAATKWGSRM